MTKSYRHLTRDDRSQIYAYKSSGLSNRKIAGKLGFDRRTIDREVKRNSGQRGYRFQQADAKAAERRRAAASGERKLRPPLWEEIVALLRRGWSPEQIAGRHKLEGRSGIGRTWIYHRIRLDRKRGGDLYKCLRQRGKKKNWRGGRHAGRGLIPNRRDISERPAIVGTKSRIGDWEGDTIIGAGHSGAIVTIVDRHSKFLLMARVFRRRSDLVSAAVVSLLASIGNPCHTITFDNGKEFANHRLISDATGADVYFAAPYHSWERGLNEHTNGLVRGFLPKGTDFHAVSDAEVRRIQEELNDRPRRALGYRTPREVLMAGHAPPAAQSAS